MGDGYSLGAFTGYPSSQGQLGAALQYQQALALQSAYYANTTGAITYTLDCGTIAPKRDDRSENEKWLDKRVDEMRVKMT